MKEIEILKDVENLFDKLDINYQIYIDCNDGNKFHCISDDVCEFLISNEFKHIGGGQQSNVFRKDGSQFVIKILRSDSEHFIEFANIFHEDFEKHFLKYVYISKNKWFAVQPYADVSRNAQEKAFRVLGHLMFKSNLGMYNNKPVIIDAY